LGGDVKVASFNVLNFFDGDGAGGGFPTTRGAENPMELDRQRAKILSAITALDADVIGLMELENDDPSAENAAIEDLVDGLNAATSAGSYAFVDTGVVGTDEIRVGIIYRRSAPRRWMLVRESVALEGAPHRRSATGLLGTRLSGKGSRPRF
jgi:predicted extracellular nuclease